MKTFDALFAELAERQRDRPPGSATVEALDAGVHAQGKKIVEEAAEVWMAAEYEGDERTAEGTVLEARPDLAELDRALHDVERELGRPDVIGDLSKMDRVLTRRDRCSTGGWEPVVRGSPAR